MKITLKIYETATNTLVNVITMTGDDAALRIAQLWLNGAKPTYKYSERTCAVACTTFTADEIYRYEYLMEDELL